MSGGLEADFFSEEAFSSRFPVHRACRDGDVGALVSLFEQLANRTHLTAEDSCYGWTPIHWAAHHGQLECVVRLVQMGCEVNTVTSRFNQTPTHTAAFGGQQQCVVWLTQAGADVNRQDFVGEAPIHKAARSGSLECIQVLLIAGAKPHLRNASGQTAADLAQAHGFHDCFCFITKTQKHLLQLNGVHVNGSQNATSAPCGQGLLNRKRLLTAMDTGHMKKARRADNFLSVPPSPAAAVFEHMQSSGGEELESMIMDSAQELDSGDYTKAITSGHHHTLPSVDQDDSEPLRSLSSPSSPPANQHAAAPSRDSSADMCGSLHLTGSPSSCVSHHPASWGLAEADYRDFLHYGHYHGFGDTAEELSDSSVLNYNSVQAEQRYRQAVGNTIHLYHGS